MEVVFTEATISVIRMIINRVTSPTDDLKEEIITFKNGIDELENENNIKRYLFSNKLSC